MAIDHIKMLCDISELNSLFHESVSIDSFLDKIVAMVAHHVQADVCSIYLMESAADKITLKATKGLNPKCVNKIKLSSGEGLVGLSFKEKKVIREDHGHTNPSFKSFDGIYEERYDAFLAVPILRGNEKVGVLVVQREEKNSFCQKDELALKATASQLAGILENARIIMDMENLLEKDEKGKCPECEIPVLIKGDVGSKGFALGTVAVFDKTQTVKNITEGSYGVVDLEKAFAKTEEQLEMLQQRVEEKLSDAASLIFSSHLLMLKDAQFSAVMLKYAEEGMDAVAAVRKVVDKYKSIFGKSDNKLIREKVYDLQDLEDRIIANITNNLTKLDKFRGQIVVTRNLLPSDLLMLSAEDVIGIVMIGGGVTSHNTILARSLHIPLVITTEKKLLSIPSSKEVLLDAEVGNIYICPSDEVKETFEKRNKARKTLLAETENIEGPTFTQDKSQINLFININLLSDVNNTSKNYIEGIGLYRTEFPFLIRNDFPSEEEQYFIYKKLADSMSDKCITFRTLDIGGDKILSYYSDFEEQNPFLGMRSIRFSLRHEDIFKQQIRAILRAGADIAVLRMMFPMVSSVEEFLKAKETVYVCMEELAAEGCAYNNNPLIGMMVEIPSVLCIMDALAKEADFFSVGTNDLIQYLLAVDRTNAKVSDLYIPHHPAVLSALKQISVSASRAGKKVSVCGDMANDIKYIPFLLGIGINELSVDPIYIPSIKKFISSVFAKDCQDIAEKMLSMSKVSDIADIVSSFAVV